MSETDGRDGSGSDGLDGGGVGRPPSLASCQVPLPSPSEHPVLAAVGPSAHVTSTSQYSHVRLAVEGRERNQRSEALSSSVAEAVPQDDVGCAGSACERKCRQGRLGSLYEAEALDNLTEGSVVADK